MSFTPILTASGNDKLGRDSFDKFSLYALENNKSQVNLFAYILDPKSESFYERNERTLNEERTKISRLKGEHKMYKEALQDDMSNVLKFLQDEEVKMSETQRARPFRLKSGNYNENLKIDNTSSLSYELLEYLEVTYNSQCVEIQVLEDTYKDLDDKVKQARSQTSNFRNIRDREIQDLMSALMSRNEKESLIQLKYLESLMSHAEDWKKVHEWKQLNDICSFWEWLRNQRINQGDHESYRQVREFREIIPSDGETREHFDIVFNQKLKDVRMTSNSNGSFLANQVLYRVHEKEAVMILLEIYTRYFKDGREIMKNCLMPFRLPQQHAQHQKIPDTVAELQETVNIYWNANRTTKNESCIASVKKGRSEDSGPTIAAFQRKEPTQTVTPKETSYRRICYCCGRTHAEVACFNLSSEDKATIKSITKAGRDKAEEKDPGQYEKNYSESLTKLGFGHKSPGSHSGKTTSTEKFSGEKSTLKKSGSQNTKKGTSAAVVKTADPEVITYESYLSVVVKDRQVVASNIAEKVQFDCGANINIISDMRLVDGEVQVLEEPELLTGTSHTATIQMNKRATTKMFGEAYFDEGSRNILAEHRLNSHGFKTAQLKSVDSIGNEITSGYTVSKNGCSITFSLQGGVFLADLREFLKFQKSVLLGVAAPVSTRRNPSGEANNSDSATGGRSSVPESLLPRRRAEKTIPKSEYLKVFEPEESVEDLDDNLADEVKRVVEDEVRRRIETIPVGTPEIVENVDDTHSKPQEVTQVNGSEISSEKVYHPLEDPWYSKMLGRICTVQERKKVMLVARLHVCSNHAGRKTLKKAMETSTFVDGELTAKDIDLYYDVKPPCVGCLQAIRPLPPAQPWNIPTGAEYGEYWEMDIFFVGQNNTPYLLMVECLTKLLWVAKLNSRKESAVTKAALDWETYVKKNFHLAYTKANISIRCDREKVFKIFEDKIQGVRIRPSPAEGHSNRAEAQVKRLKNRSMATCQSVELQFGYKIGEILMEDLIMSTVDRLNKLPSLTDSTAGAHELVFGEKPRLSHFLKCQFGEMGIAVIPPDQRKKQLPGQNVVVVGSESRSPENLKCFNPMTKRYLYRVGIEPTPVNQQVVNAMNELAKGDEGINLFSTNQNQDKDEDENEDFQVIASLWESPKISPEIQKLVAAANNSESDKALKEIDISNMSIDEAISKYGVQEATKACKAELQGLLDKEVIEVIDTSKMKKKGTKPLFEGLLHSKENARAKIIDGVFDKIKARVLVRGDLQKEGTFGETKCPTIEKSSLFLILALSKKIRGKIFSSDIPMAFLNAKVEESNLVMKLSKKMSQFLAEMHPNLASKMNEDGHFYVKLKKSLYGLKQAPRNWYRTLRAIIIKGGFKFCPSDGCVYIKVDEDGTTILGFHVDDLLGSSNSDEHLKKLKDLMKEHFGEMVWSVGEINFLGMHFVQQDDFSVTVDMAAYTMELLRERWTDSMGAEFKKRRGQLDPSPVTLFKDVDQSDHQPAPQEVTLFKSCIMELMYLTIVRVDILKECVFLATMSHRPGPIAWSRLRQLWAYLRENPGSTVNFGSESTELYLYVDAGYAEHVDSRSHTGIFITLGQNGGPLLVKSKKQNLVTQSSTEAELLALTDGVKRSLQPAKLLMELGFTPEIKIVAMQDNLSTVAIAKNGEGMGGKAKHFRVRYHFLRELIEEGTLRLEYCPTDEMVPDYLTKGMTGAHLRGQISRAMYHGDAEEFRLQAEKAVQRVILNLSGK